MLARRSRAACAVRRHPEFREAGPGSLRTGDGPHCRDTPAPPPRLRARNPRPARAPRRNAGRSTSRRCRCDTRVCGACLRRLRNGPSTVGRVVDHPPVIAVNLQRRVGRQGREGAQPPGTTRCFCAASTQRRARSPVTRPRLTSIRQLLRNARLTVACFAGNHAGFGHQHIRKPALFLPPEQPSSDDFSRLGQGAPGFASGPAPSVPANRSRRVPQRLDFHRITFARHAGGKLVSIHVK